jgi:hypothetical protein
MRRFLRIPQAAAVADLASAHSKGKQRWKIHAESPGPVFRAT